MCSDDECHSRRGMTLLPSTGVLTKEGIPFYHLRRYTLKPIHLQRIKQCGIELKIGQFSNEENKRLKRNWKQYATANNIDRNRAYEFAGGYSKEMSRDERINLLAFQDKTNFVPAMCKEFSDRTGKQVINRMLVVYHPGEKDRQWNDELEKQFEKLYADGWASRAISIRLQRPKAEVDYRINLLRRRTEKPCDFDNCDIELSDSTRQTLYGFVTKWLQPKNCPFELEEMLPEKQKWNVADFALVRNQEKAMSYLPWLSLTWKILHPVPVIKKLWLKEVERLRAACKRFDGDTEKATNVCMPRLPLISVDEYKRALNLFLEQKPMFISHLDIKQLQKRIEEENLIGYYTGGLTEGEFLKRMFCIHISNFKNTTRVANLKDISCADWIAVLIEYLKCLDGSVTKWHYNRKYMGELVSQKLRKKCENVLVNGSDTIMKVDVNNQVPHSGISDRAYKDTQGDVISYINDLEVNNINNQKLARNEESISFDVCAEYFTEKLKNLIESRILLLDEQQQRKFTKKLRKIMDKDEKLDALQRLIEKMILILEDERKVKLSKKYQKIMRKFQKMQEMKNSKSGFYCKFNEAETMNKNYTEEEETANCTNYSGRVTGTTEKIRLLDYDIGSIVSPKFQLKKEKKSKEANQTGKEKRKQEPFA
ncbi:E3 SUMO-protein ligase [Dirofilaria immitis]